VSEAQTDALTKDAFHRGAFWLVQPAERGHRAGTDALLLAAAVPSGFRGVVADLGAGAGAAGLAVLSRCPDGRAILIERSPDMVRCARATLELPENAAIGNRAEIIALDVTAPGRVRAEAGLADASVDFAIMNPPFNEMRDRATSDPLRREAHVMEDDTIARWVRTAAAIVRPRGGFAAIIRPAHLTLLLDALRGRFGAAEVMGVHPRPGQSAIRIVVRARRASRATMSLMPSLYVHADVGNGFSAEVTAINEGLASLFGD
jgi:tRNA1(Val) A37 N6-methylase TrmN6